MACPWLRAGRDAPVAAPIEARDASLQQQVPLMEGETGMAPGSRFRMRSVLVWPPTTFGIAAIYVLVGALWILLSDALVGMLVRDPGLITRLSMYKGWAYIVVTGGLLYLLISRSARERERLYQQARYEQARWRRTALMLHAIQTASGSLELDQVLQRLAEALVEAVEAPHCGIYLVDSPRQILVPRSLVGDKNEVRRALFWKYPLDPAAEPLLGEAIERHEPTVCYDALTDQRVSREAVRAWGLRSLLVVPIRAGERVLGVANLATFDEPHSFTLAEVELARGVVGAVALAIENARLYEETRRLYQQAEQLAIVEERQRIARELHDSVTQGLYGVTLYSEAASLLLEAGDLATLGEHLREIQAISRESLREMRLLIFELRPPVLEKEGLVAALEARLSAVEGRGGIETALRVVGEPRLSRVIEEELYRIAQESLNNVLKHSKARRVQVRLEFGAERVCLEVQDDGVGFEPGARPGRGGLGLRSMAERALQIGGKLAIISALGQGTRVRVEVAFGEGLGPASARSGASSTRGGLHQTVGQ